MELIKLIVFSSIGFLITVGLFSILYVLNQIAKELGKRRENQGLMEEFVSATVAPTKEDEVVEETVTFSSEKALTIDDKYAELTDEQKKYYDQIVEYANKVDGSRRFKNARYEEHKIGTNRLVRLLIKRGIIVCEFILPNSDFKNYVSENKLKIKSAPTVLKIVDENTVQIAKDSIDIAVKAIEEEREIKRQQTRERRKQARIAKQG